MKQTKEEKEKSIILVFLTKLRELSNLSFSFFFDKVEKAYHSCHLIFCLLDDKVERVLNLVLFFLL